ncbi:DapH/DapD/GlmU-related protein [Streptococcus parasuis]|uniref:DapH/DapD/GlmU-related protein n=1 Tax=Streptococcus parasuis TaxID=1501662 RepID=UPI0028A76E4E|nr:DapH/DapD/GlmU-related protein [Streptococcus parasuis]
MNRKSNYGIFEVITNIIDLLISKCFFSSVRLIGLPFYVRGKKYIDFGKQITLGRYCRFDVLGTHESKILSFGDNVVVGDNVRISYIEKIRIGNNVLIGSRVLIIDNAHGKYDGQDADTPYTPPNIRTLQSEPIEVGDNVWIGEGAVIQKGVSIGSGCVIAANTVVTKDVPKNSIVAGLPGRIIKQFKESSGIWENVKRE